MFCPRCEREREGGPWMIANRTTGTIECYCADCAIEVVEEMCKSRQKAKKQADNN